MKPILAGLIMLGLVIACAKAEVPSPFVMSSEPKPVPELSFTDANGKTRNLYQFKGKVVLLNIWATWCGPCRQEMPQLDRLYQKYKSSGFVLLGVNVDEDVRKASDVAAKLGVSFPVLLDTDKAVSKLYDLSTMPSTVIIDRDGKVRYVHRGYLAGYEDNYEKQIRELLK